MSSFVSVGRVDELKGAVSTRGIFGSDRAERWENTPEVMFWKDQSRLIGGSGACVPNDSDCGSDFKTDQSASMVSIA